MKRPLSVRERAAERARGAAWFETLSSADRFELGDQLVLGTFDPLDWFSDGARRSSAFMAGVDAARTNWEIMSS